jgi:ribosome-associated protein YbcJ (S4-like RNA binding protein)
MGEKTTIVLDTNFIISHRADFLDIHKKLSETYDVFVSDISIQERISQAYIELKNKYNNIEKFRTEYSGFVEVIIKRSFEEIYESRKNKIRMNYQEFFVDNIIKFSANENSLNLIMDRVLKKIPPFSTAENASDKGFKDTLIWLSLLEFFKEKGGDNVIFVTDDKVFRNNSDELCKEFAIYTGKKIEIKENNFFETSTEENEKTKADISKPLPDVTLLRKNIQDKISALCYGYYDSDNYGNPIWRFIFELRIKVTPDDMKIVFGNLRKVIEANLFESSISAETAFSINGIENIFPVPIEELQNALSLYVDICNECKEYLPQFYSTAANIFNKNYYENRWSSDIAPF